MPVHNQPNVLLIVLDSVRASCLSCYGYEHKTTPNLDRFCESATRYEYAISEGCWTVPSHASMFTGKPSTVHGAHAKNRVFDPDTDVLAEQLSEVGYNTYGASRNGWITSENGFDIGFDEFHDRDHAQLFKEQYDIRRAIRRHEGKGTLHRPAFHVKDALFSGSPGRALANLLYFKYRDTRFCDDGASINNRFARSVMVEENQPWFLFLNYMEAHEPYYPKSAHRLEFLPEESPQRSAFDGTAKWDFHAGRSTPPFGALEKLYTAEVRLLDERVGSLLNTLANRNALDETLVIIVGDHGQHFGERGLMGHVASPYPEAIRIPLLISKSGQTTGKLESSPTSLRRIFEEVISAAVGNEPAPDELESENVFSHCFGSQEYVFDNYPELDFERWNENLVTKVVREEGNIYGVVYGEFGRREVYEISDKGRLSVTDEALAENEDATLDGELEKMSSVDEEGDVEPVSDRLKDLGYL